MLRYINLTCPELCRRGKNMLDIKTKNNIKDIYWGEFSEGDLDKIIDLYKSGQAKKAREMIDSLGKEEFVYGLPRSDFFYYIPINKESRVLDIGCGLGVHSFNAAKLAGEVYGCDQSKKRVEFCEEKRRHQKIENLRFFHSDIESLPFKDNTFDVVFLNGVVEWLGVKNKNKNPRDDQTEDISKLRKLLKPGGTMYIGIENRFSPAYLFSGRDHNGLKYTSFMPRFLADWTTRLLTGKPYRTYTYSKTGYTHLLKDAGFENKPDFYIAHTGYNLPQFLIPFNDITALKFILNNMTIDKGTTGKLARVLIKIPFLGYVMRSFFYSYAIFVKK